MLRLHFEIDPIVTRNTIILTIQGIFIHKTISTPSLTLYKHGYYNKTYTKTS